MPRHLHSEKLGDTYIIRLAEHRARIPSCLIGLSARYKVHRIRFGGEEYGGERDILLLPCDMVSLDDRRAFLWTPGPTAARDRRKPWVVKMIDDVNLEK